LTIACVALGGCSLSEHAGGIEGVAMQGPGDGSYWVHEHDHNRALGAGPFQTEVEAQKVAGEHNAVYHMGTRSAYVSTRRDGLDAWVLSDRGWETPWGLVAKPRDLPNAP